MYSISPVYARILLRELLSRGIPEESLLSNTNLSSEALNSSDAISREDFNSLLTNARELSGDETLGFVIGQHSNLLALGPVGAAVATAPTIREGLQALENFARLHASYIRVELVSALKGMSVRFQFLETEGAAQRYHVEAGIMLVQNYLETITGQALTDAQYKLGYPEPDYAQQYTRHLHSPVSFAHNFTSIELSPTWLDKRSPYFNADIWNQALLLLAQRIRDLGDTSGSTYTEYLAAIMRSCQPPLPDLSAVAARLHVSERTLNRRLQQEGTGFRQIKSDVLNVWARQYLTQTGDSIEAIAAALGYQDVSNFRRAFRSREGCTPSEFRSSKVAERAQL